MTPTTPTPTSSPTTPTSTPPATPTNNAAPGGVLDITWPPERFFWGTLEAPGLTRPGTLPPALALAFSDDVPVPLEDLHTVMAPARRAAGAEIVVCAARRSDLEPLLASARSLRPSSLPEFLIGQAEPADLNLLVGAFEPLASRAKRARAVTTLAALWTLLALAVSLGLFRRADAWRSHAAELKAARDHAITSALPDLSLATELDLQDELDQLERQAKARQGTGRPADVSGVLAELLRAWPVNAPGSTEVQSIAANERRLALSVLVQGDPSPLLGAISPPAGWALKEPRLASVGSATRLTLELTPVETNKGQREGAP